MLKLSIQPWRHMVEWRQISAALNVSIRYRWSALPQPLVPLYKRLSGPQSQSVCYAEEKNLFPQLEIESWFISHPACGLDAIPTELPRLLFNLSLNKKFQLLRAHINWMMAHNGHSSGLGAWTNKKLHPHPKSTINWMIHVVSEITFIWYHWNHIILTGTAIIKLI